MKRYEFKITLFGEEKIFRVNGKDEADAKVNLHSSILKSIQINETKDITLFDTINQHTEDTFKAFNDIFKNFGNMFGGGNKPKQ